MNNLYYAVELQLNEGEWNGLRTIRVYSTRNKVVKKLKMVHVFTPTLEKQFELECASDDLGNYFETDEEEIQQYLDDNGMGDSEYNLIQL